MDSSIRTRVLEYMGGMIHNMENGRLYLVGGMADHVHIAMGLGATVRLAEVMRDIKSQSSRWVREEFGVRDFAWQEGYGAFTFAAPDLNAVYNYIQNQEEHHRGKSIQEEYIGMLRRAGIPYKEEYLW